MQLQRRGARGGVVLASSAVTRAADDAFRGSWSGVSLVNGGGTATLRGLNLSGTR